LFDNNKILIFLSKKTMKTWRTYQWEILIAILLIFAINLVITKDAFGITALLIAFALVLHIFAMVLYAIIND
jgi:membrane protein YdbS with pleckstrin-like domain